MQTIIYIFMGVSSNHILESHYVKECNESFGRDYPFFLFRTHIEIIFRIKISLKGNNNYIIPKRHIIPFTIQKNLDRLICRGYT